MTRKTHQAKLICIEEIKTCEHPKEKIKWIIDTEEPDRSIGLKNEYHYLYSQYFECECGAKVEPVKWEEVKE